MYSSNEQRAKALAIIQNGIRQQDKYGRGGYIVICERDKGPEQAKKKPKELTADYEKNPNIFKITCISSVHIKRVSEGFNTEVWILISGDDAVKFLIAQQHRNKEINDILFMEAGGKDEHSASTLFEHACVKMISDLQIGFNAGHGRHVLACFVFQGADYYSTNPNGTGVLARNPEDKKNQEQSNMNPADVRAIRADAELCLSNNIPFLMDKFKNERLQEPNMSITIDDSKPTSLAARIFSFCQATSCSTLVNGDLTTDATHVLYFAKNTQMTQIEQFYALFKSLGETGLKHKQIEKMVIETFSYMASGGQKQIKQRIACSNLSISGNISDSNELIYTEVLHNQNDQEKASDYIFTILPGGQPDGKGESGSQEQVLHLAKQ